MVTLGKYVAEDVRPQTPEKKLLQAFAHPVSLLIFCSKTDPSCDPLIFRKSQLQANFDTSNQCCSAIHTIQLL